MKLAKAPADVEGLWRFIDEIPCWTAEKIFLNTKGKNKAEVSVGLVNFLEYVESGHCNTDATRQDNFINRLQKAVEDVIKSREMEGRYMQFREMLDEEKAEGKAEDIIDLLSDLGIVPEKLREEILERLCRGT